VTRKKQGTSIAYLAAQALSMVPSHCYFCDHVNPTGAKFCNNCGAPLQVRPCSRCDAVNDQTAKSCYKCGMELSAPATAAGLRPTALASNVTAASPALGEPLPFRLDFDLQQELPKPSPSAETVSAPTQASIPSEPAVATDNSPAPQLARPAAAVALDKLDLAFDRQRSPFDHSVQSVSPGRPGSEMAGVREPESEIVTREPRSSGRTVASASSATPRETAKALLHDPEATTERRSSSRAVPAVALSTATLIAIGILAYYVYGPSMLLGEREGAQVVSRTPADVSESSASAGTGSVTAIGTAIPAPSVEPSSAVANSPVGQGTAAATGSNGAASQTPLANEPHPQVSTSDHASPPEQAPAKADEVMKKPNAATANTGNLRDGTMPASSNEVSAKSSAPNRPIRTYQAATASDPVQLPPRDDRAKVGLDASRPRPCTEGVAALGLCNLNSGGENK